MTEDSGPSIELYRNEANQQFALVRHCCCPKDQDTPSDQQLFWEDLVFYPVKEIADRGRDIILANLQELTGPYLVKTPHLPCDLHVARNKGLVLMRRITIELHPETKELCLLVEHRDGAGDYLFLGKRIIVPIACTNSEFASALQEAFDCAVDYPWSQVLTGYRRAEPSTWSRRRKQLYHILSPRRRKEINRLSSLIDALESLGFYQYVSPDKIEATKQLSLQTADLFPPETKREYYLDAEDIAERGMMVLTREISPFLELAGSPIVSFREHITSGGGYAVTVNGTTFEIVSESESKTASWQVVAYRTIAVVNALFRKAGVKERLFCDTDYETAAFLTDEMYRAIKSNEGILKAEQLMEVEPAIEAKSKERQGG